MRHLLIAIMSAVIFKTLPVAHAEMGKVTVAVVVKSFDERMVKVKLQDREISLPRNLVRNDKLTTGSAILVTLRGEEIRYLFKPSATADSMRRPASENNRSPR